MGQKVNPVGLRVGVNRGWESNWFANKKDFANNILEDNKIREFILNKYSWQDVAKATCELYQK